MSQMLLGQRPATAGPFACLMADPPWPEHGGGKVKRGADRHYSLIKSKEEIRDVMLGSGMWNPAENAHAHIWFSDNYLHWAMWLLAELGFEYVRTFTWVKIGDTVDDSEVARERTLAEVRAFLVEEASIAWKRGDTPYSDAVTEQIVELDNRTVLPRGMLVDESVLRMGIGQYARGCKESWLFGVRGKGQDSSVWTGNRDVRDVIPAPHVYVGGKRKHSAKPPKAYETIERVSRGPRVELFARSGRTASDGEKWFSWGDQAPEEAA